MHIPTNRHTHTSCQTPIHRISTTHLYPLIARGHTVMRECYHFSLYSHSFPFLPLIPYFLPLDMDLIVEVMFGSIFIW